MADAAASGPPQPHLARLLTLGMVGVLFLEHWLFGLNQGRMALVAAALHLACLALMLVWAPPPVGLIPRLAVPMSLFGLLILWLSLTLWMPSSGPVAQVWIRTGQTPVLTVDRYASLLELLKLCGLGAIAGLGICIGTSYQRVRLFMNALTIGALAYSLYSLGTFMADPETVLGVRKSYHQTRLTGTFSSANSAATVFGMLAVLQLSPLLSAADRLVGVPMAGHLGLLNVTPWSAIRFLTLMACLVALVLTGSRAGIGISLLVCLGMVAHAGWSRGPGTSALSGRWAMALGALILVLGTVVSLSPAMERFVGGTDEVTNRSEVFRVHLQAFLQSPWTGWGLGTFRTINSQLSTPLTVDSLWSLAATHNVYLQWAEETGLVGSVLMFGCLGAFLLSGRASLAPRRPMRGQASGLFAASLVILLHSLVDYSLQVPSIAAMWALLVGLLVGMASIPALRASPRNHA